MFAICPACQKFGWRDPQPSLGSPFEDHCIFHAKKVYTDTPTEFNNAVFKRIHSNISAGKKDSLNFRGTQFPGNITFTELPSASFLDLSESHFFGNVTFSKDNIEKINCSKSIFHKTIAIIDPQETKELIIQDSTVDGDIYIRKSKKLITLKLDRVTLGGNIDITSSIFERISVKNTDAQGNIHIKWTKIKHLLFEKASIVGNVFICNSQIEDFGLSAIHTSKESIFDVSSINDSASGKLTFEKPAIRNWSDFFYQVPEMTDTTISSFKSSDSIFEGQITFNRITVKGKFQFFRSRFYQDVLLNKLAVQFPDIGTICFKYCYSNARIHIIETNLHNFETNNTNLEMFYFNSCQWPTDKNGYSKIFDDPGKIPSNETKQAMSIETIERIMQSYRTLKRLAKNDHDEKMASEWHYQEKKYFRKYLRFKSPKSYSERLGNCVIKFFLWLYDLSSGFGERPERAFSWLLAMTIAPASIIFVYTKTHTANTTLKDIINYTIITWTEFIPFIKHYSASNTFPTIQQHAFTDYYSLCFVLKEIYKIAFALLATLFAFSLRNKLRR